ncbi:MAG: hypothetical protein DRP38_07050 [Thermotogae bacterium]|nr:MAG: hypothetical protein DRP38_07050 [Thermotogota bacterium]
MKKFLALFLVAILVLLSMITVPMLTNSLMCDPGDDSDDGGGFTDSVKPGPIAGLVVPETFYVT